MDGLSEGPSRVIVDEPSHPSCHARKTRRGHRTEPAPAGARRVCRPGGCARQSQSVHRSGQGTRRSARPCAVRRAARPRQDDAGADHGARTRCRFSLDLRAGDRQGGRPCGPAHQPRRRATCCSSTRSIGSPGGGGNPLSGDGGFPARPHHRRGAGGALRQDRSCRSSRWWRRRRGWGFYEPAARPLRHSRAAEFYGRGARTIVRRGARMLGLPLGDDGAVEIARRARGTPRIAGRLLRRVRDFASVANANMSIAHRRRGAVAAGGRCARARFARPALPLDDCGEFRRRAGRVSKPSRRGCRNRAMRSKTLSSPI